LRLARVRQEGEDRAKGIGKKKELGMERRKNWRSRSLRKSTKLKHALECFRSAGLSELSLPPELKKARGKEKRGGK